MSSFGYYYVDNSSIQKFNFLFKSSAESNWKTLTVSANPLDECVEDHSPPLLDSLDPPPPIPSELLEKVEKHRHDFNPNRYIIAQSDGGLSNRLRALFAYRLLAYFLYHHARLIFVWDVNEACPGDFLEVFEPLPNVTFIHSNELNHYRNSPLALEIYPNDRRTFESILYDIDFNYLIEDRVWGELRAELLRELKPVPSLQHEIDTFIIQHDICHQAAMHIRKTDLECILKPKQRMGIDSFFHFVDKQTSSHSLSHSESTLRPRQVVMKVFLLTDSPETQQLFLQRYNNNYNNHTLLKHGFNVNDRIVVFSEMTPSRNQLTNSKYDLFNNNTVYQCHKFPNLEKEGKKGPSHMTERRYSSLRHTVADIFIAAHAAKFKPTPFSSVGQLVIALKWIIRYSNCPCITASCE